MEQPHVQTTQYRKVVHLLESKHHTEALKEAENYIQYYPDDPDGYALLGKIYLTIDDYDKALYWANEAMKYDPNAYLAWEVKVATLYTKEDWRYFETAIKQALEIFPEEDYFYFLSGNKCNSQGDHKGAKQQFEKALQLDPDNAYYLANYSYILAIEHEYDESIRYEERALQLEVEDPIVFLYLGWAADQRGDYDKAIAFLTNAVQLNPKNKQYREEYLAILQKKYLIYRIFMFPSKLKTWQFIVLWFVVWVFFKPLILVFLVLYIASHWVTKLMVHVKVFGWTFWR